MKRFDLVIPVGPNEIDIIEDVIQLAKTNILGYNKIYLISFDKTLNIKDCITIDENSFPFSREEIIEIVGESSRIGWLYQQLLKLYSVNVIPNCLENILILDSDIFIFKPLNFFYEDKPIFTMGYENTIPYHEHSTKLHPSLVRFYNQYSGISHHMLFNRIYIQELFGLVENYHEDSFFNVFLKSIDASNREDLKCSEYEIYFSFMCTHHPEKYIIRELKWCNIGHINNDVIKNYDYVSVPKYLGTR